MFKLQIMVQSATFGEQHFNKTLGDAFAPIFSVPETSNVLYSHHSLLR